MKRAKPLVYFPGPTESELHISVANLLDWLLLPPAFYTTFPAGWGVLSGPLSNKLKRSGLKAGMPDMLVFFDGRCFGIELKARKNACSPEQLKTFKKLLDAGCPVYVCRSIEMVRDVLCQEQVPVRRTVGDDRWRREQSALPLDVTYARRAGTGEGGDNGKTQTADGLGPGIT